MIIFLIGFMGCGKSTYGKSLAKKLNFTFYDLDEEIELKLNTTIPGIFRERGESGFREIEKETLYGLFGKKKAVIACGGGTPAYKSNMKDMNKNGITVFLKVDNWKLLERLSESSTERPMLKAKSGEDLQKWVTSLLEERNPFYRQADFVINPEIINPEHLTLIIKA